MTAEALRCVEACRAIVAEDLAPGVIDWELRAAIADGRPSRVIDSVESSAEALEGWLAHLEELLRRDLAGCEAECG